MPNVCRICATGLKIRSLPGKLWPAVAASATGTQNLAQTRGARIAHDAKRKPPLWSVKVGARYTANFPGADARQRAPEHPRWMDFRQRLLNACEARECNETHAVCRELLTLMRCDVEASLEYFRRRGGYCDCNVLFNVGDDDERQAARDMFTGWPSYWQN